MKKHGLRLLAGVMTLLLLLTNAGGTVSAFAENDNAAEKKQERVLVVTQDMVGKNGKLTIEGEWDEIIVPKEIEASQMTFKDAKAGRVEVESGKKCKIEIVSGEIGTVEVVPAKTTELTVQELAEAIRTLKDPDTVIEQYREQRERNEKYKKNRPTIVTHQDAKVSDLNVSGNVKLDLNGDTVAKVQVDVGVGDTTLKVEIADYNGNVAVKQKDREDGKKASARVMLKNSAIDEVVMEGENNGSITLEGQKSEVKDVKVENAPAVTLNVQTGNVAVAKNANNVKLTVLAKVEAIQIQANGAKLEVGNAGSVESATVEGDDVVISGEGTLKNVDITGKGAYVSTAGTRIKGVNNYVAPTLVGTVRNLGGLKIVIGDWFTDESYVPTTPEEIAQQEYREALMAKYNFTIERKKITDSWDNVLDMFTKSVELGAPVAQIFILDQRFVLGNRNLCYDLSTLPELDFKEDKWNDQVREFMTHGTGIYGMSDGSSESEPRGGVIFNKSLFEKAGLDPNLPYELQKNGEWTWSNFLKICEQLKNAGVTPAASRSESMVKQLVLSTGEWLVDYDGQQYISNVDAPEIKEAVKFADELRNQGYAIDCHDDPETVADWDEAGYLYHRRLIREEKVAMQFAECWYLTAPSDPGMLGYSDMDNLGFVCCPRPDFEESYHSYYSDNVAVIPACYDAQTAADIAFAYNLWIDPVPGVEMADPVWKQAVDAHVDPRAIEETLNIFKESGVPVKAHCIDEGIADEDFKLDNFFWGWPYASDEFDEEYIGHVDYFAWEMEKPLAEANKDKTSALKAPRPDGSVSEFLTCPYEVELKSDNTILLTERKDPTVTEVEIPAVLFRRRVTELGQNLFNQNLVTSVKIPATVETIGARAFGSCGLLKTVNIPGSVERIEREAFWYCGELETLAIPKSVTYIGPQAFTDCNKLELQVVAGSYAEQYAKDNKIPYVLVESIEGDDEEVVLPDEEIETPGSGTTPDTDITPEEEVAELLYEVVTNESGEEVWITGFTSVPENLVIPGAYGDHETAVVSGGAFKNCTTVKTVRMEFLYEVQAEAFAGCTNLTHVTIPRQNVWGIQDRAFADCASLVEIYIPRTVSEIADNAFEGCGSDFTIVTHEGCRADTFAKEHGYKVKYK